MHYQGIVDSMNRMSETDAIATAVLLLNSVTQAGDAKWYAVPDIGLTDLSEKKGRIGHVDLWLLTDSAAKEMGLID